MPTAETESATLFSVNLIINQPVYHNPDFKILKEYVNFFLTYHLKYDLQIWYYILSLWLLSQPLL